MKKIILITVLAFALSAFQTPAPMGYQPGDIAADFSLKNIDGKMVSLANYKSAKGFIIVFTCNHCPFAKAYENRMIDLHKKYAAKGFPVIAINPNDPAREPEDSYQNMQKRAKEMKYGFPYLIDETQGTAKIYGATRTPHVYVLKKGDKGLTVQYIGAIDDNYEDPSQVKSKYVEQAVDALLSNKAVTTTSTKAIGCGIKWRR
jgi:glutathione peroxidase-family protein